MSFPCELCHELVGEPGPSSITDADEHFRAAHPDYYAQILRGPDGAPLIFEEGAPR